MTDRPPLDAALWTVAQSDDGPGGLADALVRITTLAHTTVPGVDYASVTVRHRSGRLETVAPSSPLLYVADGLQYELNEGPCYDAVTDEGIVYCADLPHDARWPNFGPRARTLGLYSLLAVRLVHPGDVSMALNLYAGGVGAFADHFGTARTFLSGAAVAADAAQQGRRLYADLDSRTAVEHAKGILMQHHGIDAEEALLLLSELAERPQSGDPV